MEPSTCEMDSMGCRRGQGPQEESQGETKASVWGMFGGCAVQGLRKAVARGRL